MLRDCIKYNGEYIEHFVNIQLYPRNICILFYSFTDANNFIKNLPKAYMRDLYDVYSREIPGVYEYRRYEYIDKKIICEFYIIILKQIANSTDNIRKYTISPILMTHPSRTFDVRQLDFITRKEPESKYNWFWKMLGY